MTRHERLRIARDLHDTVAQRLAGIGFSLDATIADETIPADRKRTLRELRMELGRVVDELREEILALRTDSPSTIEEWLLERIAIEITWQMIEPASLSDRQDEELRYLLLELLRNASRHSGVTSVRMEESSRALTCSYLASETVQTFQRNPLSMGRVGVLERVGAIDATLEETEAGFTLRWK